MDVSCRDDALREDPSFRLQVLQVRGRERHLAALAGSGGAYRPLRCGCSGLLGQRRDDATGRSSKPRGKVGVKFWAQLQKILMRMVQDERFVGALHAQYVKAQRKKRAAAAAAGQ